jgi:hypothetical protein
LPFSARRAGPITKLAKFVRRHKLAVAAAVALVFLAATVAVVTWMYRAEQAPLAAEQERGQKEQWMCEEAIPSIRRLLTQKNYGAAFELAEQAEQAIPRDPTLAELRPEFTSTWTVTTQPADAYVYVKPYEQPSAEWKRLGRSPLDHVRLPRGFFRWLTGASNALSTRTWHKPMVAKANNSRSLAAIILQLRG